MQRIIHPISLLIAIVASPLRRAFLRLRNRAPIIQELSGVENVPRLVGSFVASCYDAAGNLKWQEADHNQIKNGGLDYLLNGGFHATAVVTTWYLGLITAGGTITTAGDTMTSHAGWTESVAYSDATRRTWDEGASSAGVITSSTTSDFNINAGATIGGIFVTSDSAKSGTAGTLWSTAAFATDQTVSNGDVLKVNYTITLTAGAT